MPTLEPSNPIQGYYYDSVTDKLRPIAGQPGPQGPQGIQGPAGPAGPTGGVNKLDDLTDVTLNASPADRSLLLYDLATAQWKDSTSRKTIITTGYVTGDAGSSNTGGYRTICQSAMSAFSYPVRVMFWGVAMFGYGAAGGGTYCGTEIIRVSDSAIMDGGDQMWAQAAAWVRSPLIANLSFTAGQNPNAAIKIQGINYNSQNCYQKAALHWMVMEQ